MLISHEYRFLFFHVPKTGGKSVTRALLPYVHLPVEFSNPLSRRMLGNAIRRHRDVLCNTESSADVPADVRHALLKTLRRAAKIERVLAPGRSGIWYRVAGWRLQLEARPSAFVTSYDRTPDLPRAPQLGVVHGHERAQFYRQFLTPEMFEGYSTLR